MNDPVLIFFVALAAFLSYRLFGVLGTKGGHEPKENDRLRPVSVPNDGESDEGVADAPAPISQKPLPAWAETVRAHDASFEPKHFLEGARSAYEMIVTSFAQDTLSEIRPYVDPQVMKAFEVAVDGRRNAGQMMEVTFVGIEAADVVRAEEKSDHIEVTIDFRSDQVRLVRDASGELIEGDPNRIDLVKDRWTFARAKRSSDPNWTLVATDGGFEPEVS